MSDKQKWKVWPQSNNENDHRKYFSPLHSILHCSLHKSHDLYFLTIMLSLVVHPPFSRSNGSLYEKSPYICILLLSSQLYPVDVFILKEENCP